MRNGYLLISLTASHIGETTVATANSFAGHMGCPSLSAPDLQHFLMTSDRWVAENSEFSKCFLRLTWYWSKIRKFMNVMTRITNRSLFQICSKFVRSKCCYKPATNRIWSFYVFTHCFHGNKFTHDFTDLDNFPLNSVSDYEKRLLRKILIFRIWRTYIESM